MMYFSTRTNVPRQKGIKQLMYIVQTNKKINGADAVCALKSHQRVLCEKKSPLSRSCGKTNILWYPVEPPAKEN